MAMKISGLKMAMIIAGCLVLLVLVLMDVGSARTITVDDSGGQDYEKIQDAINASVDGDTILVYDGYYSETLLIDKAVHVMGSGAASTTIDGERKGIPVNITGDHAAFSGFKVAAHTFNSDRIIVQADFVHIFNNTSTSEHAEGIKLYSANRNYIHNNAISNGEIGLKLYKSINNAIENNSFLNNANYGIILEESNNNAVINNNCNGNRRGMWIRSSMNNTVSSNIFNDNEQFGVQISASSHNNSIFHNILESNSNGISLSLSGKCVIRNNSLIDNKDGIVVEHCDDVDTNSLAENSIIGSGRYGINIFRSNNISVGNNIIRSSTSHGIFISGSNNIIMINNSIRDNARGIKITQSSQNNTVENCNFQGNSEWGITATLNDGYVIEAINNWWGASSGPYHETNNSGGEGDIVTDYVNFDPWLEKPFDYYPPTAVIESSSAGFFMKDNAILFEASAEVYGTVERFVWESDLEGEFYNGVVSEIVETSVTVNGRPQAYIDSIAPNPATISQMILLSGHGTDDGTIQRYVWRTNDTELHNDTASDFSISGLPSGTQRIFFRVQDDLGVWSDEVHRTLIVHERPVAVITSITPNPGLNSDTISFNGTGIDDGSIQRYVWRTDTLKLHNDTYSEFSKSDLALGPHTIYFKVQDNYCIWSDEVSESLVIHEQPKISIGSISPNPGIVDEPIHFIGNGIDDGSIERYTWGTDEGEFYNGTDADFYYSNLPLGTNTVYVRVQDNYGMWSDEVSETVIIHERPVAIIESIAPNPAIETVTVTFSASGTDDGEIVRYVLRTEGEELYNDTGSEFSTLDLAPGNYKIYLKVQDNHGVWSDEASEELEILVDSDQDGFADQDDAFPEDSAASKDSDGDGYPDEWNEGKSEKDSTTGLKLDKYPNDSKKWKKEDEEGGLLPGFELIIVLMAMASTVAISRRKGKEK